jgi:hypothetical protein
MRKGTTAGRPRFQQGCLFEPPRVTLESVVGIFQEDFIEYNAGAVNRYNLLYSVFKREDAAMRAPSYYTSLPASLKP